MTQIESLWDPQVEQDINYRVEHFKNKMQFKYMLRDTMYTARGPAYTRTYSGAFTILKATVIVILGHETD